MKKLKEVVDKQRDEIRAKDRELTLKNEDIEAVRPHTLVWMNLEHEMKLCQLSHFNVVRTEKVVMCIWMQEILYLKSKKQYREEKMAQ